MLLNVRAHIGALFRKRFEVGTLGTLQFSFESSQVQQRCAIAIVRFADAESQPAQDECAQKHG